MPNRFACSVLTEMRTAVEVGRIDMLTGLIEEMQTLVNRMEAGLHDYSELGYDLKTHRKLRKEIKAMRAELPDDDDDEFLETEDFLSDEADETKSPADKLRELDKEIIKPLIEAMEKFNSLDAEPNTKCRTSFDEQPSDPIAWPGIKCSKSKNEQHRLLISADGERETCAKCGINRQLPDNEGE